jgi:hypothetical protein
VENSQVTQLIGCRIRLNRSSYGLTFLDYNGGGAFHFHARACNIENGSWWGLPWYTAGIVQTWSGRGVANDHSCSEPVFRDCKIGTRFPVVCEPNQSVNWLFSSLTAVSSGGAETAIVTIGNGGAMRFYERLTSDNARTVFAAVSAKEIVCEAWFLDGGFPCWLTVAGRTSPTLRVSGGKANGWRDWQHIVEVPSCPQEAKYTPATVYVSGMDRQFGATPEDVVYAKGAVRLDVGEGVALNQVKRKPAGAVVPVPTP